jgi:hypothetical protein
LSLIPLIADVIFTADTSEYSWSWHWRSSNLPPGFAALGYAGAYLPVLMLAALKRKNESISTFVAAAWVFLLAFLSNRRVVESSPWIYLWVALGACAFCYWGVHENRKLFINYGTVLFAIDLIAFYFSNVLDKLGRSIGLILLGAIFLASGWVLNRLRGDLIARAAAVGASR